eukprot:CAMPEP_0202087920 /NCGR_PEP_ID=MMETSP0964-20121228/37364_1 /ASSEMBLY_ACC=CAM_ASM_000500 /TAXON_ID=4773 /ORGANISM="Schizochytrium aggregatum, Strain ATCC28209" /LENGTH=55 /DNA_ID=CAMNT_0048655907 /DNA_START=1 /DNA_END=164 /DNA_ORIENTATION=+
MPRPPHALHGTEGRAAPGRALPRRKPVLAQRAQPSQSPAAIAPPQLASQPASQPA